MDRMCGSEGAFGAREGEGSAEQKNRVSVAEALAKVKQLFADRRSRFRIHEWRAWTRIPESLSLIREYSRINLDGIENGLDSISHCGKKKPPNHLSCFRKIEGAIQVIGYIRGGAFTPVSIQNWRTRWRSRRLRHQRSSLPRLRTPSSRVT